MNYSKLAITSPFRCPWSDLISQWSSKPSTDPTSFYVLRDVDKLRQIQQYLSNRETPASIDLPDNCLLPISIEVAERGSAEQFSIICLPKKCDWKRDQRMKRNLVNEPVFTEPPRSDGQERKRKLLRTKHLKLLKRLRRRRVRRKRRQQETAQRRVLIVTAATAELVAEQRKTMQELWLRTRPEQVRNQCSREVIGYLTQAHFSFLKAKSAGVGYITRNGFLQLLKVMKKSNGLIQVLVRNPSSTQYRKANLKIRLN